MRRGQVLAAQDSTVGGRLWASLETLLGPRRSRFESGPLGVAISGGGDSTALLLATLDWAKKKGIDVRAVTVDHGLRDGSAAEANHVATLCAGLGCPHDTLTLTNLVPGPNLQARARDARYEAMKDWAGTMGCNAVLLGHTADDVAETLVLRLRRGAGIDGLARMAAWRLAAHTSLHWGRPFLDIRRAELRDYLGAKGITPIEDPSNEDPSFDRIAVRHAMASLGLDVATLCRSATALGEARDTLDHRMRVLARELIREDRGDLIFALAPFSDLFASEPEHARRLLVAALAWVGGKSDAPRRAEQRRLRENILNRQACTLAGCRIEPTLPDMRIGRELSAVAGPSQTDAVWDGRWILDGPHAPELTVGALGDDINSIDWRATGLPRTTVMASPAVRRGDSLIAVPIAGWSEGWDAFPRVAFAQALIRR